jgi:hypothetical protein
VLVDHAEMFRYSLQGGFLKKRLGLFIDKSRSITSWCNLLVNNEIHVDNKFVKSKQSVGKVKKNRRELRNGGRPYRKTIRKKRVVAIALGDWNGIGCNEGYVAGPLQAIKRRLKSMPGVHVVEIDEYCTSKYFPLVDWKK